MLSGARLAMVTVVHFTFPSMFSINSLQHLLSFVSVIRLSFPILPDSLNAVLLPQSLSSSPPFPFHFLCQFYIFHSFHITYPSQPTIQQFLLEVSFTPTSGLSSSTCFCYPLPSLQRLLLPSCCFLQTCTFSCSFPVSVIVSRPDI